MGMAYVTADDVDTSSSTIFNELWAEPESEPWRPRSGACPSEPVFRTRPCVKPPGHEPQHFDGYGTSWWPVSCVDCGGNHETGVRLVEYRTCRWRCISPTGCRRRQRRNKINLMSSQNSAPQKGES